MPPSGWGAPADSDLFSMCRDGIPPYRIGSKKQLQREMHRSVKANGQVSLPHFPVSSGGSCRVWVGVRTFCGGMEQGRSDSILMQCLSFPEKLLGAKWEPRALSILAETHVVMSGLSLKAKP